MLVHDQGDIWTRRCLFSPLARRASYTSCFALFPVSAHSRLKGSEERITTMRESTALYCEGQRNREHSLGIKSWNCAGDGMKEELVTPNSAPAYSCGHRLALVNVDWTYIRAVDIYAVFQSFSAGKGDVQEVTVYLSQYGEYCMQRQALGASMSTIHVSKVLNNYWSGWPIPV